MRLPARKTLYDVCLGATLALAAPCVAAQAVRIPASDSGIEYAGHWGSVDRDGQPAMATINSSSQIYLNFTGTHVAGLFNLKDIEFLEQIYVKMDDEDWTLFTIDHSRLEFFPKGLPEGPHHFEIAVKAIDGNGDRWLPPLRSAIVFSGFELESNAEDENLSSSSWEIPSPKVKECCI